MKPAFEITLERLTYGGEAMGRLPDGRAVFVPFALPGEQVKIRLTEEKRGFARAELLEVLKPSHQRIAPRCPHFGTCGGCHYQHLPYPLQLQVKTDILREQLQRIGRIAEPPVAPMVASPAAWNYRNHVQFHLTEAGKIGFVNAKADQVIAIQECHLPEEAINTFWPNLQFDSSPDLERISLRCGSTGDLMLILESDSAEAPEVEIEAEISAVHLFAEHAVVLAGEDHLFLRVLGRDFRVSAGSFFQVNTPMAEKMVEHLLTHLPISSSDTLLDVYCGVGLFSAFFAHRAGRIIGIESSASACEDFVINLDEFENVELYEGLAEDILPRLTDHIGQAPYVLVDPPRAGLEHRVLDTLLALEPPLIAYVSCDPATLARDARRLTEEGYSLTQVTPFDLFPQTYHIESISIFQKR